MTSPRDAPVGPLLVPLMVPSPLLLLLHKRELLLLLHHGHLTLLLLMVPTPKVSRVVAKASGRHLVLVAPSLVLVVHLRGVAGGMRPRGSLHGLRVPHGLMLVPLHVTAPAV